MAISKQLLQLIIGVPRYFVYSVLVIQCYLKEELENIEAANNTMRRCLDAR